MGDRVNDKELIERLRSIRLGEGACDEAASRLEQLVAERDHFHALYEKALEDAKHLAADRDECLEMFHSERGCCDATKAKFARAQEEIEGLRNFARGVLEDFPDSFPDGFDLQDLAIKHGLLVGETVTKPCRDEGCHCAEYHGEKEMAEGVTCYRRAPALAGAKP